MQQISFFFAVLLCTQVTTAFSSEIFSWKDEKGRTHYGNEIPEQYKKQATSVNIEVRKPTAAEIANTRRINASYRQQLSQPEPQQANGPFPQEDIPIDPSQWEKPTTTAELTYEEKMAAYKKSQACFRPCRTVFGGTNRAQCSHCKDIKRPTED